MKPHSAATGSLQSAMEGRIKQHPKENQESEKFQSNGKAIRSKNNNNNIVVRSSDGVFVSIPPES